MSTRCAVRERRLMQSRARPGNFWGDFFFSNISLCLSPKRDAPFFFAVLKHFDLKRANLILSSVK